MNTSALCIALIAILAVPCSAEVRTFTLGEGDHPWRGGGDGIDPEFLAGDRFSARVDTSNTPGNAIEFDHKDGWISPRFFDGSTNIAALVLEEGGSIKAPNLISVSISLLKTQLEGTVNGDHDVAFERKPTSFNREVATYGIWVELDFGRLVGVQRVRFYPRNTVAANPRKPFHNDFLRGYEVWINQRLTSTIEGAPDQLVERVLGNQEPVVDVEVVPQYVRLIKLRSLAERPFEIDEIEVYGAGYLDSGIYQSDLIDLGAPATVGLVRWVEGLVGEAPFSDLSAQVRSGLDDTPILYQKRIFVEGSLAPPAIVEVSGAEYWTLEPRERVLLEDDTKNWSPWKSAENHSLNPAPTPRRYLQFRLHFKGGLFATREVDRLEFDYLIPPIADVLRAEIFPRLAAAEKPATFRYAVLLKGNGPIQGYDRLEVDTNAPAAHIRQVKLDGEPVEDFKVEFIREEEFCLSFPLIQTDGAVLEFTFDLPIFRFGTTFSGRAYNSRFNAVPQRLEPGQVVRFEPADVDELSGLAVAIPKQQIGKLVGAIALQSRVFTPNGDGVNDRFELSFNLLQLLRPAPVRLDIYDLQGRRVRRVFEVEHRIGEVAHTWDGRLSDGRLVAPGAYIWVLSIQADAFEERHSGVLAVAY